MDSGETGMNSVPVTIINSRKEYLAKPGIEPATSCTPVLFATDWATQERQWLSEMRQSLVLQAMINHVGAVMN